MTRNSAEEIIERFGGIRPMAGKLNIPVTTVQGWKKRNFIPPARLPEIQSAAEQNNIDISDLIESLRNQTEYAPENSFRAEMTRQDSKTSFSKEDVDALVERRLAERLAGIEKKTVTKSAAINIALLAIALAAGAALLWPYKKIPQSQQQTLQSLKSEVGALKGDIDEIKEEQGGFLSSLKEDVAKAQAGVQNVITEAQGISSDLTTGTLEERVAKLEGRIGTGMASSMMNDLLARYQTMTQSPQGEAMISGVVTQLNALLPANLQDADIGTALQQASTQDPAVGATFEGVPQSDMKAAAMLLAMTQFRSSLGRDNKPFTDDLELLVKLTGENDPALKESILKLAPYSEQGILTPAGLTTEFKTIAGDAVVASLQGEDVSLKDRASARLNEVFKVEKNGELITGTPTQATLAKTEDFLSAGNIESAIAEMRKLQGPAAVTAAPWINKAEATLMAQKLKMTISHAINARAAGNITATGGPLIPGTLIQNDETGINILKQDELNHNSLYKKH